MQDLAGFRLSFLRDLHRRAFKWALFLLAFELRAIAAITAGFAVAFVVAVPAGILTGLALNSLELDFQYVRWAILIIQIGAFAIWLLAALKVYAYVRHWSPQTR